MNGSVTPVSGRTLRLPAAMMNAWIPMTSDRPDGEQRPEVVGRRGADPQAALDDHEEQAEDGQDPDDAQLLAERREREVGVDLRDRQPPADLGQARPEPDAEQPAAGEGVERLDDLVAGAERVGERVEPDVDARPGRGRTAGPSARLPSDEQDRGR